MFLNITSSWFVFVFNPLFADASSWTSSSSCCSLLSRPRLSFLCLPSLPRPCFTWTLDPAPSETPSTWSVRLWGSRWRMQRRNKAASVMKTCRTSSLCLCSPQDGARKTALLEDNNNLISYYYKEATTLYEVFQRGLKVSGDFSLFFLLIYGPGCNKPPLSPPLWR